MSHQLSWDIINKYLEEFIIPIYNNVINSAKKNTWKEENFRTDMAIILNKIFSDLKIDEYVNVQQEFSVYKWRIDSLYGNIILEYKWPGKIKSYLDHPDNIEYINQVKRQINWLAEKNKIDIWKILGIIFDWRKIIYLRYKNTGWEVSNIHDVTIDSLKLFIKRLLSLSIEKKALTIENLLQDFNSDSILTKSFVSRLYYCYEQNNEYEKVNLLFEQRKQLFREVCWYDFNTLDMKIKNLKNLYDIKENVKIEYLIFAIQTYFALIIKILSIEVLWYLSSKKDPKLTIFHIENKNKLVEQLDEMEQGWLFKKLWISNFLEWDFFSWYLYFFDETLYNLFKDMIMKFENYDYSSINIEPDLAKDLLKNVYHNLFPRELRHNLWEYYTPDRLAEFLINKMEIDYNSRKSILDPTCWSWTFIILLIKKFIDSNKWESKKQLLDEILSHIKWYDLNPLAVISARANYIIGLWDLINERAWDIEIPIYLYDSMLSILEEKQENEECYVLSTKVGVFSIPKNVVHSWQANKMLDILNKCIKSKYKVDEFMEKLLHEKITLTKNETNIISSLYLKMYDLELKWLDWIWTNIIKNSFAPLFQEKVDYIIWNPPWIVWQSLPENYRNSIQKYRHQYGIFEHKWLSARLWSSHDDISVLMTYVIMDNFLKDNWKLWFIVNQNIFQSSWWWQWFRKFLIKDKTPIKIEWVDDFVLVQPFKDLWADNKTAVFTAKKNESTEYPVIYNKRTKKETGKIYSDESYDTVFSNKIEQTQMLAQPIKEYNSSWIIGNSDELKIFTKMVSSWESSYKARKWVDTSANAVYRIKSIEKTNNKVLFQNSPETSKKEIKSVTDVIENELVYPLVRWKDIYKWNYSTPYSIIIPYTEDWKVITKRELKIKYENWYNYFYNKSNWFIDILTNRAILKKHFKNVGEEDVPEYSLYDIWSYTFSKYKVVWKALASWIISTVIWCEDGKIVIPDHNLVMIPFDNIDEAFYVSWLLNSKIVTDFVNAYVSRFFSTHVLNNLAIPKYNNLDVNHKKVVNLSKQAHNLAKSWHSAESIEKELNMIAEKILLAW